MRGPIGRILGGKAVNPENGTQWPWQVAIFRDCKYESKDTYKHYALLLSRFLITRGWPVFESIKIQSYQRFIL